MRLSVRHSTRYTYEQTGSSAVQRLRLTPLNNLAQSVLSWSITAEGMDGAAEYVDGFGNRTHLITHCKPYDSLTITAEGDIETRDTGGVIGHLPEAANPLLFMRATPLTESSGGIADLAGSVRPLGQGQDLEQLHRLMELIAGRVVYLADTTGPGTSAAQALEAGQGVCQDHAHIFIAAARLMGISARYVTGYLRIEGEETSVAHHAWAEAYLPDLGWIGFDPSNRVCPTEAYVRLACGFDAVSAAPISGARRGGGKERLSVEVRVHQQQQQQQQQ